MPYDPNYLEHHGTKGMKKGVRNYQNKDGSLTPLGREHYGVGPPRTKIMKENDQYFYTRHGQMYLKKGAELKRATSQAETLDGRRKYVSVSDTDAYNLTYDLPHMKFVDTYKTNKTFKIASAEQTVRTFLDSYGDLELPRMVGEMHIFKDLGDLEKAMNEYIHGGLYDLKNTKIFTKGFIKDWKEDKWRKDQNDRMTKAERIIDDMFDNIMMGHVGDMDKLIAKFKEQGYDAVTDINDYLYGYSETPLIVLDPKSSMSLTKTERKEDYRMRYIDKHPEDY
jgi:hypothetical protein